MRLSDAGVMALTDVTFHSSFSLGKRATEPVQRNSKSPRAAVVTTMVMIGDDNDRGRMAGGWCW